MKDTDDLTLERRGFLLSWLSLGWLAFSSAGAITAAGMARFMFPNVLFEPALSFRAGQPEDYAVGEVDERWKDQHGVWIVRTQNEMFALLATCTHLGCSPNWSAVEQVFKCPCHGSGFDRAGMNLQGPAPRPLERVAISLAPNGEVIVDKSRKFAHEKGEWNDPASFLVLG